MVSRSALRRRLACGTLVAMRFSRREFSRLALAAPAGAQSAPSPEESHIGSLYPFVQGQADAARQELSFLQPRFRDLKSWKPAARRRVLDHLFYTPAPAAPDPQLISRTDRGDYIEEHLTFRTTPDIRVPAFVLLPKDRKGRAPGVVALHDHGGFYLFGKEKITARPGEHPVLGEFRDQYYGGRSTAVEMVRRGYVVAVIDMFYWGERRLVLGSDPASYKDRPPSMSKEEIAAFNRRSGQNEQLVARSLFTAGISWPGVILWDDLRTVDYLCSRPEVDPNRIASVGLSVGGYRSFLLAALDERVKAAVDVGWMTSFPFQVKRHVQNTVGLTFHIPGLLRYLDLPDLAALAAPRALLVINGSQDRLFAPEGVRAAFEKIGGIYRKAGVPERQACRLYDAPHQFNEAMQEEAWRWLARWV
ncbi:MAG: acetylxylan esterase [Bryobacterales bacterium]|nr:acetylxylan esterase [Bryobacterales bacterium]